MKAQLRSLLKRGYYALRPPRKPAEPLALGYCFHTEQVYDARLFAQLLRFCEAYTALTGAKALCTLMSGANPRVQAGMAQHQITDAELAQRFRQLGEVATLGYHGHFWLVQAGHSREPANCQGALYHLEHIASQMATDLAWFKAHDVEIEPYYAAGWWFINPGVYALLAQHGFRVDASQSAAPWYYNGWTASFRHQHQLSPAQPAQLQPPAAEQPLLSISNLVGCHTSAEPRDFLRHLAPLLARQRGPGFAFVNSHDYDLHPAHTLAAIRLAQAQGWATWHSAPSLAALAQPLAKPPIPLAGT